MYVSEFWVGFVCCFVTEVILVMGAYAISNIRKGKSEEKDEEENK